VGGVSRVSGASVEVILIMNEGIRIETPSTTKDYLRINKTPCPRKREVSRKTHGFSWQNKKKGGGVGMGMGKRPGGSRGGADSSKAETMSSFGRGNPYGVSRP